MLTVELVQPTELTNNDIRWLVISANKGWDGVLAIDLVNAALAGNAGIYRITGEARGVFVLEPRGQDMKIIGLAGEGFLKHFPEVHKVICDTAKGCGAKRVVGLVARGALSKMYEKYTAAKVVATVVVEDLT